MSLREFGIRSSFALGRDGTALRVHVAGVHLTEFDENPYWLAFRTALHGTLQRLTDDLNFLKHEPEFLGVSVEEAHRMLLDPDSRLSHLHTNLRFADWGPTTDGHVCFLIPLNGSLYVSCSEVGGDSVASAKLRPYDVAATISQFLAETAQPIAAADGFAAR